jgi:hypothetical protein
MQNRHFIAAGFGSALAMLAFAGLNVSTTPAAAISTFSSIDQASQKSNRALKGDRSPLLRTLTTGHGMTSVARDIVIVPELPDGCEAIVSSIGNSPLTQIAGSCVS